MKIDQSVESFCSQYKLTERDRIFIQLMMDGYMDKEIVNMTNTSSFALRSRMQVIRKRTSMNTKQDLMAAVYRIEKERKYHGAS